jgi:ATP-dependent exoDNAse (exonuclease V) beta subunit
VENITFISAGAGSGKTYSLMEHLGDLLLDESSGVRPEAVIATTFTIRAANELKERVQHKLLEKGQPQLASQMETALVGTVNGVFGRLLKHFAFELGLSPKLDVIPENEVSILFHRSLDTVLELSRVQEINALARRFDVEDWRSDVEALMKAARSNNIPSEVLKSFGRANADRQLSFCRTPVGSVNPTILIKLFNKSVGEIDTHRDTTKTTRDFIDKARAMNFRLTNNQWSWGDWASLSKTKVSKKSQNCVLDLTQYASEFDKCLQFHDEVREYLDLVFITAADAMSAYQSMKTRLGLIDFVDQERELLRALELPAVRDVLSDELDLLMVDEFQDTSPIQLALFLKLSELATKVIWVGDMKQSIYGFRGSDPSLMLGVINTLKQAGQKIDTLPNSWRSRPELVELVNQIFVPAFSSELERDQVALNFPEKRRSIQWPSSAVQLWTQNSRNDNNRQSEVTIANDNALGVHKLLLSSHKVIDKVSDKPRPIRPGDIGILCRTGKNVARFARALEVLGIPVNLKREVLMETPEAVLVKAALRILVTPNATLARAELISLVSNKPVDEWLDERLQAIASDAVKEDKMAGLQDEKIDRLIAMCDQLRFTTPEEALRRALWVLGISEIVIGWGGDASKVHQRLLNLDELLSLAKDYEQHCLQQNQAANLAGLLHWWQGLSDEAEDSQAKIQGIDAVTLVTHHGAKGLEWPVVICCDYADKIINDLWGVKAITTEAFDVMAPLSNRFLHYWVAPSQYHGKGLSFIEKAEASDFGKSLLDAKQREAQRLVYVSMTRARDLLILTMKNSVLEKGTDLPWLSNVGAQWLLEANETLTLPNGDEIPSALVHLAADEPELVTTEHDYFWFAKAESKEFLPAVINPSKTATVGVHIQQRINYCDPIVLPTDRDVAKAGTGLHAILATQILQQQASKAVIKSVSTQLLVGCGLSSLNVDTVLMIGEAFKDWLVERWPNAKLYVECPISMVNQEGQRLSGSIDLLIETEAGWIVIDHKSTSTGMENLPHVAAHYGGQLAAYREALEKVTNKPVIEQWLNFMMMGTMLRCELS